MVLKYDGFEAWTGFACYSVGAPRFRIYDIPGAVRVGCCYFC